MTLSPAARGTASAARPALCLLVALAALAFCPRQARAAIYYVSSTGSDSNPGTSWAAAQQHVQAGINAAASGDQVWVKTGTYTGNFTAKDGLAVYGGFAGTETSISQRSIAANPTILDGNSNGTVYTVPSSAAGTNTLDGFTIQHGASQNYMRGGGFTDSSSDTFFLSNCTLTNNSALNGGGALMSNTADTVTNCTFVDNTTINNVQYLGQGGGVFLDELNPPPTGASDTFPSFEISFVNCTFTGNSATFGGGIYSAYGPKIVDCTFTNNSAQVGGGVYTDGYVSLTTNCTFTSNGAPYRDNNPDTSTMGGGIYAGGAYDDTITNCIFRDDMPDAIYLTNDTAGEIKDNLITSTGANNNTNDGIDVYQNPSSIPLVATIANNTIVGTGIGILLTLSENTSFAVANNILYGNYGGLAEYGTATFTQSHNDVYGNIGYNYSGPTGPTDMSVNPIFVNTTDGDYRLASTSPLINAGDDSYVASGDTDLAGNPRIYGSHVDIGGYEYYPAPTLTSFTPTNGPVGTVVTITGTNLTGATVVGFQGQHAKTFTVNGAGTQITATVPAGALTGPIAGLTPGGEAKTPTNFTVTAPKPVITGFAPASGPVGTVVTITGTNLAGTTVVGFQGQHVKTFTVNSQGTQITTTVPVGAITGPVAVLTPGGEAKSAASFTVTL